MKRQTFLRSLFAAPLAWLLPKPAEADEWLHVTPGDPLLYDGTEWKIAPPPESGVWCRTYVVKDCMIRRREFKWSDGCMNVESPIYEKDWTGEWTRPEFQTCERLKMPT